MLSQVSGAVRLDDGRIVVGDPSARQLIAFDSTGARLGATGREGKGPGEFEWVSWLGRCAGDSIYVWDARSIRMTVLSRDMAFVREFHFSSQPTFVSCFPGNRFALLMHPEQMFMVDRQGHSPPMFAQLIVADLDGDSVQALGRVQLGQTRPLGLVTHLAGAPERLYLGTGDSSYVEIFDSAGHPIGSIRVGPDRRPPTLGDYAHAIDEQLEVFGAGDREPARKAMLSIPMPDLLPAYQDLLADPTGAVWAVISGPGDSITAIRGTTANGRSLGELHFPDWFTPFEVGTDYVLGAAQTPDGEQHVRKYRLRRGEGGAPRVSRR